LDKFNEIQSWFLVQVLDVSDSKGKHQCRRCDFADRKIQGYAEISAQTLLMPVHRKFFAVREWRNRQTVDESNLIKSKTPLFANKRPI